MWMSKDEIIGLYREAPYKKKQIRQLAELNAVSERAIINLLRKWGVYEEQETYAERQENIAKLALSGVALIEIAEHYKCSYRTVLRNLNDVGIYAKNLSPEQRGDRKPKAHYYNIRKKAIVMTDELREKVLALRAQGMKQVQIGKELNLSPTAVFNALHYDKEAAERKKAEKEKQRAERERIAAEKTAAKEAARAQRNKPRKAYATGRGAAR